MVFLKNAYIFLELLLFFIVIILFTELYQRKQSELFQSNRFHIRKSIVDFGFATSDNDSFSVSLSYA